MTAFGKVNVQREIPDQQAHMFTRIKLQWFYLSQHWRNNKCLHVSRLNLTLMWPKHDQNHMWDFPAAGEQMYARLCSVVSGDSDPMPQAAASHGTEVVWDSRSHRNMHINTKCSPVPKVEKVLASQIIAHFCTSIHWRTSFSEFRDTFPSYKDTVIIVNDVKSFKP